MTSKEYRKLSFFIKPNESLPIYISDGFKPPYSTSGKLNGELKWSNDHLIFTPTNDFSGNSDFLIKSTIGKNETEYKISIQVSHTFKPRARIIKIIGQELISNDVIALVELIKNSYDADSTQISLSLNDIFSSQGQIIVTDDGEGMSFDKIVNVWLEPATPDKKSKENRFSKCFNRRLLGEKGIGRFAVHRLGEKIVLVSRARKSCSGDLFDYETTVEIDWRDFTEDKYLEEIPIKVYKTFDPQYFKNNSGTYIRLEGIHPWKSTRTVRDAVIKIKGLESPVKPKRDSILNFKNKNDLGLNVLIESNDIILNKELKEIKSLDSLLKTAFYKFSGIIDDHGGILYDYSFNRVDYQDIRRDVLLKQDSLIKYDVEWFEEHPINHNNLVGSFEVNFYAWDLEPTTLKVAGLADYYRNIIKPNAGIRIYRDNFRVWPYGEPEDDWLGLDLKRLNEPKERSVSRNQVFGVVNISSTENSQLRDQSNREGLIFNDQYDQFYRLVSASVSLFAKERKEDKIKIDKVAKNRVLNDIVTENIYKLKNKVAENNHSSFYISDIEKIESSYKEKINDVLERYMMAAAIGISYSMPIHEMKLRLSSIKHIVEDIEKNPILQDKYLRQLIDYIKDTEDIIKAVSSIMSRQKLQKISLVKVAQNVHILKESELKKYKINYRISGDENLMVEAVPGLLNTALLNLVDNAIYWLRAKKIDSRTKSISYDPKILIKISKREDGKIQMEVIDNGDGFEDPFELLVEPYFSRKTDGLGLGLYLVNEIMIRQNGRLEGYNNNGAVVTLLFNNNIKSDEYFPR